MKKRLILGLVAILSVIATQGGFLDKTTPPSPDKTLMSDTAETHPVSEDLSPSGFITVTRVVDGDTIVVLMDGKQEKIRLIGVDTPETVDPRKPVQCFGKEASAFTKSLLSGTTVKLEADPSQGDRDKYGRLLRYVFLEDGTLVNQKIIAMGYGHEYTYRTPYKYRDEFKSAEHSARESQKGLWGNGACSLQNIK